LPVGQQLSETVFVEDGHVKFVSNIVAALTPVGDALKRAGRVFDTSGRNTSYTRAIQLLTR
jgi:hypothetical protein